MKPYTVKLFVDQFIFRYLAAFLFIIVSCEQEAREAKVHKEQTETGAAFEISEWSATLSSYANPTADMNYVTMGVLYSLEESPSLDNGKVLTSVELDKDNMYTVKATNLASDATYYYKSFLQYGGVYRYGQVKSFKTLKIDASVATLPCSDITELRATMNGKLSVNSKENLGKSVWFLYSKTAKTIDELKTSGTKVSSSLNKDSSFSYYLWDLDYGQEYYYVGVAKVHDQEFYGSVNTFSTLGFHATVSTLPVTDITEFKATLHGQIDLTSTDNLNKSVWFLYSKTSSTIEDLKCNGTKVSCSLSSDGSFGYVLNNLEYGTRYYCVAVAKVQNTEFYGEPLTFNTLGINATVNTLDASDITEFKATLNGRLNVTSTESLGKSVWFLYSKTAKTAVELKASGTKVSCTPNSDGSFKYGLSNLEYGSQYYCMAVAKVHDTEFYGEPISFNTLGINATVNTLDASDITEFKATLNGRLEVNSTENLSKSVWFLYSKTAKTADELKTSGTKLSCTLNSDGSFKYVLNNLEYGVQYFCIAVAKVHNAEFYGEPITFNTLGINATVNTLDVSDITEFKATLNGKLKVTTTENLSKSVWFLYSKSASTIEELKASGTKVSSSLNSDGSFKYVLDNLEHGTRYYCIAVAKVLDYEIYGSIIIFNTVAIDATITTLPSTGITENKATIKGRLSVANTTDLNKKVWFLYSKSSKNADQLISAGTKIDCNLNEDGTFSHSFDDLKSGTVYSYIAVAEVYDKLFYGNVTIFQTKTIDVSVRTLPADNIAITDARLNGELDYDDASGFDKNVWFLYSKTANTVEQLVANGASAQAILSDNGCFSVSINTFEYNTEYYYVACARIYDKECYGVLQRFKTEAMPPSVNMGLSVKWASCNIGATSPEEGGNFYAWGETETKTAFSWASYKYCEGSKTSITKYCISSNCGTVDGKTVLETGENGDDVAFMELGEGWRLPTKQEWDELKNNSTWSWTTIKGVKGYKIKSKIKGYTSNWIFLPAGGVWWEGDGSPYISGNSGYYWSSTLWYFSGDDMSDLAAAVFITSDKFISSRGDRRCQGHLVRPVTK